MAKIIDFKVKSGSAVANTNWYEPQSDETLSFDPRSDGSIGINSNAHPNVSAPAIRDWSNQELADLYRVCHLLHGAKVYVETDRGVTDEGDPWFVFCLENGEVFIHLCRVDGLYILDCVNLKSPLKGSDFSELIANFTDKVVQKASQRDVGHVIQLQHNRKLRLHPSAMMAALIWTLFLASEELVLVVPENDSDEPIDTGDVEYVYTARLPHDLSDAPKVSEKLNKFDSGKILFADGGDDVVVGVHRETNSHTYSLHPSVFTIGLSSIAVALGLLNENFHVNLDVKLAQVIRDLDARLAQADGNETGELPGEHNADFDNVSVVEVGDVDQVVVESLDDKDVADVRGSLGEVGVADKLPVETVAFALRDKILLKRDAVADVDALSPANSSEMLLDVSLNHVEGVGEAKIEGSEGTKFLLDLVTALDFPKSDITVAHVTIKSATALVEFDNSDLFDWISTPSLDDTNNAWALDTTALRLVEFLEAKDGDMYYLTTSTGVLIVDVTAKSGGETATLYWEAEDGQVISFVGLASDFAEFNLVA